MLLSGRTMEGIKVLQGWVVLVISLAYLGFLFAIAYLGDKVARRRQRPLSSPVVYALALAVYCTSWTYYGSVGVAASTGYNFLPIYIGPILMFTLGWMLVRRITRLAKSQNITSIADFIGARYGKSQGLAAAVTVIAVIGTVPYIALQLKAVSTSFQVLMNYPAIETPAADAGLPIWGDTTLAIAMVLALFAILFGTRHTDATEHNEGMVLAIAFESLVKLAAFILVGAFVVWGMFDGFSGLFARAAEVPEVAGLLSGAPDTPALLTMTLLAFVAIICLPRQFHVTVVENTDERQIARAAWLFPLYLVAINIFVIPIALAGRLTFDGANVDADTFVLALPIAAQAESIALFAFLGGLSAATGMVIVASVALSNMVSNDLVMPILLRSRWHATDGSGFTDRTDIAGIILQIRRLTIVGLLLLAYVYFGMVGDSYALASIGLLSFAAVAQFGPAFFGGLYWRGATKAGALAGISIGFLVWGVTLLLPSLVDASLLVSDIGLAPGADGRVSLLGWDLDPLTRGVILSLFANIVIYVGVSLLTEQSTVEQIQAAAFVGVDRPQFSIAPRLWRGSISVGELKATAARYVGEDRAEIAFRQFGIRRGTQLEEPSDADLPMIRQTERLLASAIGTASARLVLALSLQRNALDAKAAMKLLDDASDAIQYNRELLEATIESIGQGIAVFDKDFRLACWNKSFIDLLEIEPELARVGVPAQELLRRNAERGEYGAGEPSGLIAKRMAVLFSKDMTRSERRRPDGTVIESHSTRMPDGGYVVVWTDVTERVQAAEELARANESLERRVLERTAELTELNAELGEAKAAAEAANLGKTRFLAAASHDLLQPLNAARLYASSLLERRTTTGGDDTELVGNLDASLEAVEDLLSTLLDISKLDAGGIEPSIETVCVAELFDALRVEFAPLAEAKGLELKFVPCSAYVMSDRRLLRRILENLLSNALRYTARGGVLVGARRSDGHLNLTVVDTGRGVPAEKHAHIFQEFHRLGSEDGTEHGLGLGLSIVRRISRVLGHEVSLKSRPGIGSSFWVSVPETTDRAASSKTQSPAFGPLRRVALNGAPVMCVDNDPHILDGISVLLRTWSCDPIVAADTISALERMRDADHPPVLILADYHLDDEDNGLLCIEKVRAALGTHIPAALVTADRSEWLREQAASQDVSVLPKPVKPAAIRAMLTHSVSQARAAE